MIAVHYSYGTLIELGYAKACRRTISVTISSEVDMALRRPLWDGAHGEEPSIGRNDLWFATLTADKWSVTGSDDDARTFHSAFIKQHSAEEYQAMWGLRRSGATAVVTFGDPLNVARGQYMEDYPDEGKQHRSFDMTSLCAKFVDFAEAERACAHHVGDRVHHCKFGSGTVTAAHETSVDVRFDKGGEARVMSDFVRRIVGYSIRRS